MNAINDFLINLFTRNDDHHPVLTVPNLENGYVYASDWHALIAIPENEVSLSYKTNEKYPNVKNLIDELESKNLESIKVKVETLSGELAKCRLEADRLTLKCKECGGDGNVEWEYQDKSYETHYKTDECPICKGEGDIEINHPFPRITLSSYSDGECNRIRISIGNIDYDPFQIYRLFMVALAKGYKEIEIFYDPSSYGQTIAHFGNIKVFVMAILKNI